MIGVILSLAGAVVATLALEAGVVTAQEPPPAVTTPEITIAETFGADDCREAKQDDAHPEELSDETRGKVGAVMIVATMLILIGISRIKVYR